MNWVRPADESVSHVCDLPAIDPGFALDSLYRCDTCERLWRVGHQYEPQPGETIHDPGSMNHRLGWRTARWRQRLRYLRHDRKRPLMRNWAAMNWVDNDRAWNTFRVGMTAILLVLFVTLVTLYTIVLVTW